MNKNVLLLILLLVSLGIAFVVLNNRYEQQNLVVTNFEECVAAGNPVMESFPEQCRHGDQYFVRELTDEERELFEQDADTSGVIIVDTPSQNTMLTHETEHIVAGQARGQWYFEGTFPFEVRDSSGNLLLESYVSATDDWMTTEFVPFTASFILPAEYTGEATVILKRNNASGLPEHDAQISIPVTVSSSNNGSGQLPPCFVGGCSSHVCSDNPDVMTTCEWREEYACYRETRCERQQDGQCGWTETPELRACLGDARDGAGVLY